MQFVTIIKLIYSGHLKINKINLLCIETLYIFVSLNNFESEAGAEWVIGACVKSPCVAAGNNELVSAYR